MSEYIETRKPYLEFTWRDVKSKTGFSHVVNYEMVVPLYPYDCRNSKRNGEPNDKPGWMRVRLSQTRVDGFGPVRDGKVETPSYDGIHACRDARALGGLEVWARYKKFRTQVEYKKVQGRP